MNKIMENKIKKNHNKIGTKNDSKSRQGIIIRQKKKTPKENMKKKTIIINIINIITNKDDDDDDDDDESKNANWEGNNEQLNKMH